MYLSDFLKNGATVQSKAAAGAIAANDLLVQNMFGQVSASKVFDYAAAANINTNVVGATVMTSNSSSGGARQRTLQYTDGSIFIIDPVAAGPNNVTVKKYNQLGVLQASVLLATPGIIGECGLRILSNGNIVAFWMQGAVNPYDLYFAVIDQFCNVAVNATLVQAVGGTNPNAQPSVTPLTAGGFIITWTKSGTGVYFAIYTNAGAVTKAATSIAGVPAQTSGNSLGCHTASVQLSNTNIAIALGDENTYALAFTIVDTAGTSVVGYTAIGGASAGIVATNPQIQAVPGFFCIAPGPGGNAGAANAYVYSNAGVLQGAGYTASGSNVNTVLMNDGTNFYAFFYGTNAGTTSTAVKLATSGTNTATQLTTARNYSYGFYDLLSGFLVVADGTHADSFVVTAAGSIGIAPVAAATIANAGAEFKSLGDYCALCYGAGTFQITKYADASIVGVSQQTLAAGNANTVISYTMGPGGYPVNALIGSQNKAFDHSGSNLIGNKGTMLGNAVSLKGI